MPNQSSTFLSDSPKLRGAAVFVAVWGAITALFTLQLHLGADLPLAESFVRTVCRWLPWVLLTPVVFWLTAQFPFKGVEHLPKHGSIHAVASILIALFAQFLFDAIGKPVEETLIQPASQDDRPAHFHPGDAHPPFPPDHRPPPHDQAPPPPFEHHPGPHRPRSFLADAATHLPRNLPTYWALMGIQSALLFGRQLRRRERQALELEAKLTQSQLDALKLQLQPHFLFNTLNAISTLVYRDPKTADRTIGNLSTLLRAVLEDKNANKLPLSRELQLLDAYMNIEAMRFEERVQFEQTIDSDCRAALLPPLLLQPIVENAVRHGLEPLGAPGVVRLTASQVDGRLSLVVEDNGVGPAGNKAKGWGIGLSNAEARLQALYGPDRFSLELKERPEGGTRVTIELPFETDQP